MRLYIASCKSALTKDCGQRIILRPKTVLLESARTSNKSKLHGSVVENAVGEGRVGGGGA